MGTRRQDNCGSSAVDNSREFRPSPPAAREHKVHEVHALHAAKVVAVDLAVELVKRTVARVDQEFAVGADVQEAALFVVAARVAAVDDLNADSETAVATAVRVVDLNNNRVARVNGFVAKGRSGRAAGRSGRTAGRSSRTAGRRGACNAKIHSDG